MYKDARVFSVGLLGFFNSFSYSLVRKLWTLGLKVFRFCWNCPRSWFCMLLTASMYDSSVGVPHMYLASLDIGTTKTVCVQSPVLRDKIPT